MTPHVEGFASTWLAIVNDDHEAAESRDFGQTLLGFAPRPFSRFPTRGLAEALTILLGGQQNTMS
jgi:hypothetical protein